MKNEIMAIPKCPSCGGKMEYRPGGTPEQRYCGAWYDCTAPGCSCSVLIPSKEIRKLYGMEAAICS